MELQYWAKDKWWLQDEYSRLFAYHGVSQQEVEDCISRVMQVFTPEWQQAMATAPHPAFLALLPQGILPLQYLFNLGRNLRTVAVCLRVQEMIRELRLPASYESAYLELQIAAHLKEKGHEVEFRPRLANGKESDLLVVYGCQRTHFEIKRMETSQHQKALDALGNEVWFAVDVVGFASQYPHLAGKGFLIDLHQSLSDLLTGPDNDRSTIRSIVQTIVTEIGKHSENEQEFEIPSIATVVVMEGRVEGCGINWPMASCQEELKRFIRTHLQNAIAQLPPDHPGLIVAQMSGLLDEELTTTIIHGWLKDSDAAHVSAVVFLPVYNPMPTPWALFKPFVVLNSQARFPANDLRAFADFAPVIDREITIPTAEA